MTYIIAAMVALHCALLATASARHRLFLTVLLISHVYFCVAGYWYWVFYMDTYFVGTRWGVERIQEATAVLSAATAVVALVVWLIDRFGRRPALPQFHQSPAGRERMRRALLLANVLFGIGALAALVVVMTAGDAVAAIAQEQAGVFLIAFQFSDLMIPATLFVLAQRGFTGGVIARIVFFFLYAVFTGMRYKIVLLIVPAIILKLLQIRTTPKRIALGGGMAIALLAVFSLMTIFRAKFAGFDFEARDPDILFGAFAEASILFGLSAILHGFVSRGLFYPLDPFFDSLAGFIPRVLLPSRTLSGYLVEFGDNMLTYQGSKSGTAYPFIGEFAIIGGWPIMVVGAVCYALLYLALMRLVRATAPTAAALTAGAALIAVFVGYLNYSRGYMPQLSKSYVFVLAPYIWLCWLARPKVRRAAVPRPRRPQPSHLVPGTSSVDVGA